MSYTLIDKSVQMILDYINHALPSDHVVKKCELNIHGKRRSFNLKYKQSW